MFESSLLSRKGGSLVKKKTTKNKKTKKQKTKTKTPEQIGSLYHTPPLYHDP